MTAGFSQYKTAGGDSILQNDKSKNDGSPFEFADLSYYIRLDGAARKRHLDKHVAGSDGRKSLEAGLHSLFSAAETLTPGSGVVLTGQQAEAEWMMHLFRNTLTDRTGKADKTVEENLPSGFHLHGRTVFYPSRLDIRPDGSLYVSAFAQHSETDATTPYVEGLPPTWRSERQVAVAIRGEKRAGLSAMKTFTTDLTSIADESE